MGIKYRINDVRAERVLVTAAQILGMFATPVTVVKAPGANKVLLIDSIHLQTLPGATAFAAGGIVTLVYHGGAILAHGGSIPAATLISATGSNNLLSTGAAVIQPPANTALDITNATQAFTLGNGTAVLTVYYKVLTLG